MNDIVFQKTNGNLGRTLPGEDHISALLFYTENAVALPAGFGTDRLKQITSLSDAEDKGITSSDANYKILHYHIQEFFRIEPKATLYVYIAEEPAAGDIDFEELKTIQNETQGKVRQAGIFVNETFAGAQVTAIQTVCDELETLHMPLSVLFVADFSAVADLSALADLRALDAEKVSVILGQDGGGTGAALFTSKGITIGFLGAALGALAKASVSESFAWIKKFPMVTASELDVPALGEGSLMKDLTSTVIDGINTKGYIFLRKFVGLSNTYINDTHCSISATDDFAYIENNRTIDKAIRNIRTYVLPELNAPLRLNEDGTLTTDTIKYFETKAARALDEMLADGDIGGYDIEISPTQDVVSTNKLVIKVQLVINGVARNIEVQIGLVSKIEN